MKAGRIPAEGFVLLASAPYEEPGVDRARAVLYANFMRRHAEGVRPSPRAAHRVPLAAARPFPRPVLELACGPARGADARGRAGAGCR